MPYTLGIDLHKYTSTWVLLDQNRKMVCTKNIPVDPVSIKEAVESLAVAPTDIQVGFEPVCAWRFLREELIDVGMEVHIANPLQCALITKSHRKNDTNDAHALANLLYAGFFPESYCAGAEVHALRDVVRTRHALVRHRTSMKNRIHGITSSRGIHTIPGGHPLHKDGIEYLKEHGSTGTHSMLSLIECLDTEIQMLDQEIVAAAPSYPAIAILASIPGMGILMATMIVAETGDFGRFPDGRHYAAYTGLVPRERSSGGTVRLGHISKTGPKLLRYAFVEAAMRVREHNAPELYQFVSDKTPQIGAMKARVALARKLATLAWTLVTREAVYDPSVYHAHQHMTRCADTTLEHARLQS